MKFDKIVSFGDSWTVGEGFDYKLEQTLEHADGERDFFGGNKELYDLRVQHSYTKHLADSYNIPFEVYGTSGGSNETIMNNFFRFRKSIDDIKRHVVKDASDIQEKYVQSGVTVDLGIMYIPSESLMQLIDSIENLRESIFRDSRVLIMGPNSLAAYLISVHMGFRTLALNNRAGEIMEEFGKLKKEFERFGSSTEELLKKADAMLKAVNEHAIRERQMNKAIKNMDQLDS